MNKGTTINLAWKKSRKMKKEIWNGLLQGKNSERPSPEKITSEFSSRPPFQIIISQCLRLYWCRPKNWGLWIAAAQVMHKITVHGGHRLLLLLLIDIEILSELTKVQTIHQYLSEFVGNAKNKNKKAPPPILLPGKCGLWIWFPHLQYPCHHESSDLRLS